MIKKKEKWGNMVIQTQNSLGKNLQLIYIQPRSMMRNIETVTSYSLTQYNSRTITIYKMQ